jgi:cold shock CspA family protein
MTGKIARVIPDKGFGFIKGEDGKEYFFHRSEINGFWEEFITDAKVEFDNDENSVKGPRAANVKLVNQHD